MRPINIAEYEDIARQRLHPAVWDYFSGGANDEVTLHENRAAFARIQLRPRVLVDVSQIDLATTLLEAPVTMPICVAPSAMHGAACADGECATAQAAGALGTLVAVSTESTRTLEEIAQAATGPLWFQLYFSRRTRGHAERLAKRAEAAGYRAIALTVDSARWGHKEQHERSAATYDWPESGNFRDDPLPGDDEDDGAAITWEDVAWLRSVTSLPLVIKGILTAEDAALCVERGIAGIIVSNHGGRQLDTVPATIEALPEVVEAVAGRCEVYLDGGVRRGTDVLKALALGARGCLIGKAFLYALAARGEAGVALALDIIRKELAVSLALTGANDVRQVTRDILVAR